MGHKAMTRPENERVSCELAAKILKEVASGVRPCALINKTRTWGYVHCGNVEFQCGDAVVVIFNDCDEVDYVDEIRVDGKVGDFDSFLCEERTWRDEANRPSFPPVTDEEWETLHRIFKEAT